MSAVAKLRQAGFVPGISPAGGLLISSPSPVELDQEALEERAAILEFEAGFSRDEAERLALALMSVPPVDSAIAPPPVAKPGIVCCGDCAHSVLPPDTCPVYGWRLCGLDIEGGGGFGRAVRRCAGWETAA